MWSSDWSSRCATTRTTGTNCHINITQSSALRRLQVPRKPHTVRLYNNRRRSIAVRMAMAEAEAKEDTTMAGSGGKSREELNKGIAELYDESSGIWEDIWGDHMHHGYYDPSQNASLSQHRSAQIRMIEEALRFAAVTGLILSFCMECY